MMEVNLVLVSPFLRLVATAGDSDTVEKEQQEDEEGVHRRGPAWCGEDQENEPRSR